ncbi:putative ribonuclease H-like domain-containing protein [Tanacetum coccineum]|uniref:Ribonuclease H-like domain-containing protein n=1 Tax=Tanacetum coccineum TaxID=301880 RepID=A0ABQ5CIN7_9ASTR
MGSLLTNQRLNVLIVKSWVILLESVGLLSIKKTEQMVVQEKKTVAIEDSNSKALVATDNNEDIDWTKEFDAEPTTFAMMALTEVDKILEQRGQGNNDSFGTTSKGDLSNSQETLVPSKSTANVTYQDLRSQVISPISRLLTQDYLKTTRSKKIVKSIWVKKGSTVGSQAVLPQTVKKSAMINPKQTWRPKGNYLDSVNRDNGSYTLKQFEYGHSEEDLKTMLSLSVECSGSMTGDKDKLSDFKEFKGGYVLALWGGVKFNLLSVSQICDKKHNVLFTDKECLILSPKFKFVDEDLVILRAPRKNDVYSLDLKNIIPSGGVTCLVAKATNDEVVLWHRRLGHVNLKNINKLVQGKLYYWFEALPPPLKTFKIDHSCLACNKGKQHRASCKKIEERTVREPLELLHMDLFGPVSVESVNRKKYCLVVTDDCSKFSWVFFLAYKDETYDMLHDLIVGLENRLRHKVKTISKGFRVYNRVTRKVQECLHVDFLENQENQKGKGPDWMFDLDLLTPSMNYIPVRKENYADSKEQGISCDDVEDLDDQQFIVHTAQPMHTEEQSLAKAHNDDQRIAFEEEKKRIALDKGKECVDSTFTLSTANYTSSKYWQYTYRLWLMIFQGWCVFSTTLVMLRMAGS